MSEILSAGVNTATVFAAMSVRTAPALPAVVIDTFFGHLDCHFAVDNGECTPFPNDNRGVQLGICRKTACLADGRGLVGPVIHRGVAAFATPLRAVLRGYHDGQPAFS